MFHVIVAVIAVFGALWALAVWVVGGFSLTLAGLTVQSHDPLRPLGIALAASVIFLITGGRWQWRRLTVPFVVLLSLAPAAAGVARNSWTAGGADSYAYVSQADLWVHRNLSVPVPLAGTAPWPEPVWTFSPHGFVPAVSTPEIVPVTAPGLPLLMAAAKALGGHSAMFLVTPLSGAMLVWFTFLIGRRIGSDALGVSAAWLTATSPAVLAMLVSPMSDVPAAALWAAALCATLGNSTRSAWAAGAFASAAILVRPNLSPLAAVLALWRFWSEQRTESGEIPAKPETSGARRFRAPAAMVIGIVPGCLFIAWLNNTLYGSPLSSGYGSLSSLFSTSNVAPNIARYGGWLIESQTPLFALGGIAVLFPIRAIWRTRGRQHAAFLLGASAATVWVLYLIYTPYDAWWFLRFLLPSWPALCVGTAAVLLRLADLPHRAFRAVAFAVLAVIGVHGLRYAAGNGAFPSGEGDHRYASIATIVADATDPSAVIITGQNGGPVRYYAGRTIVRFDLLDPAWLDRAMQWLGTQGRHPYLLLEDWEVPHFKERFRASAIGGLPYAPLVEYRSPGVPGSIYLFDPARPDGGAVLTAPPSSARDKCVQPHPLLNLR